MNIRLVLLIIVGLFLFSIAAIFFLRSNKNLTPPPTTEYSNTQTNSTQTPSAKQATPAPSPVSKTVPVTTRALRGTITAVSGSSITLSFEGKVENLSLSNINDVYKLTGGTIEGGDAKTTPAKVEDIKTGQEVLAIVDKDSPQVQRIVIIK